MPKPRSCNASVAALIRKFGLPAVQSAVEMAIELAREARPAVAKRPKPKATAAAAVARFDASS